jgi:hypothetical protein
VHLGDVAPVVVISDEGAAQQRRLLFNPRVLAVADLHAKGEEGSVSLPGVRVEFVALAHDVARLVGIVPEIGRFRAGVQVVEPGLCSIPVKDASSAGSAPARFRRRLFRSRPAWVNSLANLAAHVVDRAWGINPRVFWPS